MNPTDKASGKPRNESPGHAGKAKPNSTDEGQQATERRPFHERRRRAAITAIVLSALVILVLPVVSMLQPAYYARYPGLQVRMRDWRSSTHAVWSCSACHIEPGTVSFLSFAAKSIPAYYSQLIEGPSKTNIMAPPTNNACRSCHTMYRTVSPGGDLLIPHRAHVIILKLKCVNCHQRLVHWPNKQGFNRPKMTYCLGRCHDGHKATNKCTKCHTRKNAPLNHKAGNWLAMHGKRTKELNCGSCHGWAPKLCQACHKNRPRTHVGNWKKLHQARARERGKGCLFCHGGRRFCLKCHD